MTVFNFSNSIDKNICDKAFYYNAWLLFGKDNSKIDNFKKIFVDIVKKVNILPYGSTGKYITPMKPGTCSIMDNNNELEIEAAGMQNAPLNRYPWVLHEIIHEYCHAFSHLAPKVFSKYPNGKIINDAEVGEIKCDNTMGLISEKNSTTGELIGSHYYGDMFRETMMDMITSIGLVTYDPQFSKGEANADTILKSHYSEWYCTETRYTIFTSITRLMIAAFSNNGYINYQEIINNENGIFDPSVDMKNGEKLKANDFIYGIMCDPLYVQECFDKYEGEGAYRLFAKLLDRNFRKYKLTAVLPQDFTDDLKVIMKYIANFLNVKLSDYINRDLITVEGKNKIIDNFNIIWNSMLNEYNTYFDQEEYDEMYRMSSK